VEAKQLCAPTRNIAVTAEISVDLPSERIGAEENDPEVWTSELAAKGRVRQESTIVCNHALAEKARKNQQHAVEKTIRIEGATILNLREADATAFEWAPQSSGETD